MPTLTLLSNHATPHSHPWVRTASSRLFGNPAVQAFDLERPAMLSAARSLIQQITELGKTEKVAEEDVLSGKGGEIETDVTQQGIALCIKNVTWLAKRLFDASANDTQRRAKDMTALWKQIKLAAYNNETPHSLALFKTMSPQMFFGRLTAAVPGAVVRLAGVLLVRLYSDGDVKQETEDPESRKRKRVSGSRARHEQMKKRKLEKQAEKEKADDDDEEEVETSLTETSDAVFAEIRSVVTYIYASAHIPAQGSLLAKTASEVLDVLRNTLTSERFVRLFHTCSEEWRTINSNKHTNALHSSHNKGKQMVSSLPQKKAVPKREALLPTSDGGHAKAGSRKRAYVPPSDGDARKKRKIVKRK